MTMEHEQVQPHLIPYAKTNQRNPEEIHLLLYHLIDVGIVAEIIWQQVLSDGIRRQIANSFSLDVEACGRFLAFLVATHDLGKAGPAYQKKYAPAWLQQQLADAGLALNGFGKAFSETLPHGTVSAWSLITLLPGLLKIDRVFAKEVAIAVGGHHGIWPSAMALKHIDDSEHPQWGRVRVDLCNELLRVFAPPLNVAAPPSDTELNSFLVIFSGLTSVADWVGSQNDTYFGYIQKPLTGEQYAQNSRPIAQRALAELGWLGWQPTGEAASFGETFAYLDIDQPRPVQQTIIDQAITMSGSPTMLIVEAQTGIGKTELALYIADRWVQCNGGRGIYVAMPTQATSNQMYSRVGEFLHKRYPDQPINYHLVHGQAAWLDELRHKVELQGIGDEPGAHISAESWFGPRKRTLLAPFGVGTVDQALLSVLQVKHFFVRLFGLSHKVVIFDEVHAYDTYMNTIFHSLLTWLNALGTSVIILSATLPTSTRRELVKAYSGKELLDSEGFYPALTIASDDAQHPQTLQLPKSENYLLHLDWSLEREPEAIVEYLERSLAAGGYAAVICNRVGRAQDVYRALKDAIENGELDVAKEDLILFHSRFPPIWRKDIESKVLRKFGKDSPRHGRAIVVATQVIEQSLDIDFDLMISDLAPIDLLLQRAGRLHRHANNDGNRYGLRRTLLIVKPELGSDGAPVFGKDIFVYDESVLLRTYCLLHDKLSLTLPGETPTLIESVYDERKQIPMPLGVEQKRLDWLQTKWRGEKLTAESKAGEGLVLEPGNERLLEQETLNMDEEDPSVHEKLRAKTRDIDFSLTVVCLHSDQQGLYAWGDENRKVRIDLAAEPDRYTVKVLLQNALSIQHQSVGRYLIEQQPPSSWSKNAALRYCRHAVFDDKRCDLPEYLLHLTKDCGLEIIRKGKA